jgi:aspartyl-tRNA(Asn)/glutamyl-tRNA(Gln) amidotransferase subunit C
MAPTLNDIKHIADLALLEFSDMEAKQMLAELNNFLQLVSRMRAVDTTGIVPLTHPIEQIEEVALRLRSDSITETVNRDASQKNAPAVLDGLYLVPRPIE